ncbi:hypothetical protein [Pseudoclavibacter terrae]|uniref:hypothetical protein n=1 Tax=Pseudoclavibacter terrae TaxID=1530195 RepID=UPI00232CA0CA|nr:hypothetical protein [Pseudoclavibacter terrae]
MDWIEWTAKPGWLDVLGLLLTIGGLLWAIKQTRDAKDAAGDAKTAADNAKDAAENAKDAANHAKNAATNAKDGSGHAQRAAELAEEQSRLSKAASEAAATESREATVALQNAQEQLSSRAALMLSAQFQSISHDLTRAMDDDAPAGARGVLLRFGHLAKETNGVLESLPGDHSRLKSRLSTAAGDAIRSKVEVENLSSGDVRSAVQKIATEIEKIGIEMTELSSTIRHKIHGGNGVQ